MSYFMYDVIYVIEAIVTVTLMCYLIAVCRNYLMFKGVPKWLEK